MPTYKLRILTKLKKRLPVVLAVRKFSSIVRRISFYTHKFQYKVEWSVDNPEHYEHYMDLHYQWKKSRKSFPMERAALKIYS